MQSHAPPGTLFSTDHLILSLLSLPDGSASCEESKPFSSLDERGKARGLQGRKLSPVFVPNPVGEPGDPAGWGMPGWRSAGSVAVRGIRRPHNHGLSLGMWATSGALQTWPLWCHLQKFGLNQSGVWPGIWGM